MQKKLVIAAIIALLFCCGSLFHFYQIEEEDNNFSFFVAGHVYGSPGANNIGVHPAFKKYLKAMGKDSLYELGVYTGDIVKDATEKDWDEVDEEINTIFKKPIYFAPGNHDMADSALYVSRYTNTYHAFDYKNNRFILLDGNKDHWNISSNQLDFFNKAIKDLKKIDNLFIFSHQVLWWRWDNKYKNMRLNSHAGYKAFPNYWEELHPKLDSLNIPVYMIAGDVGAAKWAGNYMYDKLDNVHLITSGMGENIGDNYIEVAIVNGVVELKFRFLSDSSYIVPDTFVINN